MSTKTNERFKIDPTFNEPLPGFDDKMGKLTYLTVKACQAGGSFWVVQEAVASTALAHPEWNLTERRSFSEWEGEES